MRMTRRGVLGLAGAGAAALLLAACGRKPAVLRYRLTVEVDTPDGLRSGSSIIETRLTAGSRGFFREFDKGSQRFFGEAVTVDLGRGRYLFALLSSPINGSNPIQIAADVLRYPELQPPLTPGIEGQAAYREAAAKKPTVQLRRSDLPTLVTFADIAVPKSFQFVDPDALDRSFGDGYRLRRVIFAVTDEAPTAQIEKLLGWLGANPDESLDPGGLGTATKDPRYWLRQQSFIFRPY